MRPQRWEYTTVEICTYNDIDDVLNEHGKRGWELVANDTSIADSITCVRAMLIFKRPSSEPVT